MTNRLMRAFVKERDEALLSLDKDKILAYMHHYGVPVPKSNVVFWAGIHKARIASNGIPEDEKEKSRAWLTERGFSTTFGGGANR